MSGRILRPPEPGTRNSEPGTWKPEPGTGNIVREAKRDMRNQNGTAKRAGPQ